MMPFPVFLCEMHEINDAKGKYPSFHVATQWEAPFLNWGKTYHRIVQWLGQSRWLRITYKLPACAVRANALQKSNIQSVGICVKVCPLFATTILSLDIFFSPWFYLMWPLVHSCKLAFIQTGSFFPHKGKSLCLDWETGLPGEKPVWSRGGGGGILHL